jgi:hypothetical protein
LLYYCVAVTKVALFFLLSFLLPYFPSFLLSFFLRYRHTALTFAALRGTMSTNSEGKRVLAVEMLLDRREKRPLINRDTLDGHTALSWAAHVSHLEVMECLLDRGADVDHVTHTGNTALHSAACNGKWAAVRLLLERGADVAHKDVHGKTAR